MGANTGGKDMAGFALAQSTAAENSLCSRHAQKEQSIKINRRMLTVLKELNG